MPGAGGWSRCRAEASVGSASPPLSADGHFADAAPKSLETLLVQRWAVDEAIGAAWLSGSAPLRQGPLPRIDALPPYLHICSCSVQGGRPPASERRGDWKVGRSCCPHIHINAGVSPGLGVLSARRTG